MKKLILSFLIIFAAAAVSTVSAQQEAPAGAGDKNLRDEGVRMRSIDLERTKRDAAKTNSAASSESGYTASINTDLDKKYPQIKEDFEGIQSNQAAIIKAYTTGESIDYKQIKTSADEINKSAKRLDENLFAPKEDVKKDNSKAKPDDQKSREMKELIVDLDNAIGDFTSSAMFQNLRVVDPQIAGKTRLDLDKIVEFSETLSKAADKLK